LACFTGTKVQTLTQLRQSEQQPRKHEHTARSLSSPQQCHMLYFCNPPALNSTAQVCREKKKNISSLRTEKKRGDNYKKKSTKKTSRLLPTMRIGGVGP
jgi:hypothetical protein